MTKVELDKLAHRMATDAARIALDSFCENKNGWHNTKSFSSGCGYFLVQAMRYLEARKMIRRHPQRLELVKVKGVRKP